MLGQLITNFMEEAQIRNVNQSLSAAENIITDKYLLAAYREEKILPSSKMLGDIIEHLANVAWVTEKNYDDLYNESTFKFWYYSLSNLEQDYLNTGKRILKYFNDETIEIEPIEDEENFRVWIGEETVKNKSKEWIDAELRHIFFNIGYLEDDFAPRKNHEEFNHKTKKDFPRARFYDSKPMIDTGLRSWWFNYFTKQLEQFLDAPIETFTAEEETVVREFLFPSGKNTYNFIEQIVKVGLDLDKILELDSLKLTYKGKELSKEILLTALTQMEENSQSVDVRKIPEFREPDREKDSIDLDELFILKRFNVYYRGKRYKAIDFNRSLGQQIKKFGLTDDLRGDSN